MLVTQTLRQAAARYAPSATVDACDCTPGDVGAMLDDGATAFICDSVDSACRVLAAVEESCGPVAAGAISVAAVGCACGEVEALDDAASCTGYFVDCRQVSASVLQLLCDPPPRPAAVWLVGAFVDRGTLSPADAAVEGAGDDEDSPASSFQLAHLLL
jgi:hypothetical protein